MSDDNQLKRAASASLCASIILFGAISLALVVIPARAIAVFEVVPAKIFLSGAALVGSGHLGWSVFRWLYLPSARRYLITISAWFVAACIATAILPTGISQVHLVSSSAAESKKEAKTGQDDEQRRNPVFEFTVKSNDNSTATIWALFFAMFFAVLAIAGHTWIVWFETTTKQRLV